MNILILFSQPWRVGGAETHVEALMQGLTGHTLFLTVNEGSNKEKLMQLQKKFPNVEIIKIQARGANVFRWIRDLKMLCAFVKQKHIQVISAQQRTAGIWAYIIRHYTRVPYTVTMHDPWHRAMFKSVYAKIFSQVFCVSRNLSDILQKDFGFVPAQIQLINNGIDFKNFKPKDKQLCRQKLGLDLTAPLVLHVSRLSRVKGAVTLKIIDSLPNVLQKRPETKLILIGEGPLRATINEKILAFNQQYGNKIQIYDFVSSLTDWYNAVDILIGEGRVAMETLACLKPIVAIRNADTFIGAVNGDNIAYACDVNFDGKDQSVNADNMASAMELAFQLEQEESQKIADYIKERLSLDTMAQAYMDVFKRII